jgi:heat shock protein HtpX
MPFIIVTVNVIQWLLAPYLIDAMYRVKEVKRSEDPKLYETVERLSRKSRIKMPRVMLSSIPIPNAFAYGSPIAGNRVAVTTELLKTLESEEVEAVVGHELGHLRHRDVQVMMFVSILPALFYWIGYSMLMSSRYSRRDEGGSGVAVIAIVSMLLYWVLSIFTLYLSRLREYSADSHSVSTVEDGSRKLSEALAKIQSSTSRLKRHRPEVGGFSSLKTLFITDPDHADFDTVSMSQIRATSSDQRLVEEVLKRRVTSFERLVELFSTHPNIVKRLRALKEMA